MPGEGECAVHPQTACSLHARASVGMGAAPVGPSPLREQAFGYPAPAWAANLAEVTDNVSVLEPPQASRMLYLMFSQDHALGRCFWVYKQSVCRNVQV
eukprot:358027-Chlamydomonas_euryale.AAC.5